MVNQKQASPIWKHLLIIIYVCARGLFAQRPFEPITRIMFSMGIAHNTAGPIEKVFILISPRSSPHFSLTAAYQSCHSRILSRAATREPPPNISLADKRPSSKMGVMVAWTWQFFSSQCAIKEMMFFSPMRSRVPHEYPRATPIHAQRWWHGQPWLHYLQWRSRSSGSRQGQCSWWGCAGAEC